MAVQTEVLIVLVTINIAVLTGFGAVIWAAYRSTTGLRVSLHGENGDRGFIERTLESTEDLAQQQRELRVQLELHGKMLNEAAITIEKLAEVIEKETDASVELDRLDDIHDRVDTRWQDERDD